MVKLKNSLPKGLFRIAGTVVWISLALVVQGAAEDKKVISSPAEAIGEAARQVSEESKAAYHETRDAVARSSKEVVEGAKKAVQEARGAGTQVVKDVKKGLSKEPASRP
jgi:hypothetical protein